MVLDSKVFFSARTFELAGLSFIMPKAMTCRRQVGNAALLLQVCQSLRFCPFGRPKTGALFVNTCQSVWRSIDVIIAGSNTAHAAAGSGIAIRSCGAWSFWVNSCAYSPASYANKKLLTAYSAGRKDPLGETEQSASSLRCFLRTVGNIGLK